MSWRKTTAACLLILLAWLGARWLAVDETAVPVSVSENAIGRRDEVADVTAISPPLPSAVAMPSRTNANATRKDSHRMIAAPNLDTAKPVEQIRFWRQQATTGDHYARCRFAVVAIGCAARRKNFAPWARNRTQELRSADGELIAQDCSSVTDADLQGRSEALLGAAQGGHAPSALLFAMGGGLSSFIPSPDEIRVFRAHAPRLAWQAFAAGNSDAAVLLWRAYNRVNSDGLFLASAIEPDPIKAHALDLLMGDLVPEFLVGNAREAELSEEQAAQAAALHATWRSTAFAHGRPSRYGLEIEQMFEWERRAVDLCAPDVR